MRTSAPTRTRTARGPLAPADALLAAGQLLPSPETGLQYRVGRMLGQGGFGQVYLSTRLGKSGDIPQTVCIKVSAHIDGWLREAYFGAIPPCAPSR